MRFWFVHSSEIALREQIVTQVKLGILSGELGPGERLPSIRELARRFHIHSNTVSGAYGQLHQEYWVSLRRGSGVYVRDLAPTPGPRAEAATPASTNQIEHASTEHSIAALIRAARMLGMHPSELRERFLKALDSSAKELLLVEPEPELSEIVASELRSALGVHVKICSLPIAELSHRLSPLGPELIPLALPSKATAVRAALRNNAELCVLQIRPIADTFARHLPKRRDWLVGIASHWPQFLEFAKTMLIAAAFPVEALVVRDARQPGWQAGLEQADAIICDSVTATLVRSHKRVLAFPLISEETLRDLLSRLSWPTSPADGKEPIVTLEKVP